MARCARYPSGCHKPYRWDKPAHIPHIGRAHVLAQHERLVFLCGRYEGIDDRVRERFVDECLSLGDFVLSGGEIPALAVVLMLVSTVAVGGLAYLGASGQIQRHVMLALVDWFLTLFADGWFGLAILALASLHSDRARLARQPVGALGWIAAIAYFGVLGRSAHLAGNEGYLSRPPRTWDEIADVATLSRPDTPQGVHPGGSRRTVH